MRSKSSRCRKREPDAFPLAVAAEGQTLEVRGLSGCRRFAGRMAQMGFVSGARVRVVRNRRGMPLVIARGGSRVVLRRGEAMRILCATFFAPGVRHD